MSPISEADEARYFGLPVQGPHEWACKIPCDPADAPEEIFTGIGHSMLLEGTKGTLRTPQPIGNRPCMESPVGGRCPQFKGEGPIHLCGRGFFLIEEGRT